MTEIDSTPTIPTKRCTVCKTEFPATTEFFYRRKTGKYGVMAKCKGCWNTISNQWRENNLDKCRENERRRYAQNPEKFLSRDRAYYAANREKETLRSLTYQQLHREQILISRQRPEARLKARLRSHHRRVLERNGTCTPEELANVLKAHTDSQGRLRCAKCGEVIQGQYHIDHWIPLKHGGTNNAGNLRIMHPRCNRKKAAKLPLDIGLLL